MKNIIYHAGEKVFRLNAGNACYCFGVTPEGFVEHLYYGPALASAAELQLCHKGDPRVDGPQWPQCNSPSKVPCEFTTCGLGDFRSTSSAIRTADGHIAAAPLYKSHRIYAGKDPLAGLPSSFGSAEQCGTLELVLADELSGVEYILSYTVFDGHPVIARSLRVVNGGKAPAVIERLYSATVDFPVTANGYEQIIFPGGWARERHPQRQAVATGVHSIASARGVSSHEMNPAFILVDPETTETSGVAIGQVLVYSGSWKAEIERDQFDAVRTHIGISPDDFRWPLAPGAEFQAPEMLLIYSAGGLEELSHASHDFFRAHILRGPWRDCERPVLLNNWEATYFNFNEEKLLDLARTAVKLGVELFVLDDGWFGQRNADDSSLGDWFADKSKLPGGIGGLSRRIHELGLKFGLWFEPEMISENSDLYRAHPDYCLHIQGRTRSISRRQLALDFSRPEVVDCVFDQICRIFDNARIDYMKWDCNRPLTEVGSAALPPERQGEVMHRRTLGYYDLLGRLRDRYPDLLIEGCAGGGGRFDAGTLCYTPQIWCSDDTDAVERLAIQYGTSFFYPCSAMGAHVSDCPNHQVGRITPFSTRADVAMAGTFGYELDPNRISEEERQQIPQQIKRFHALHHIVTHGDYYRLLSPLGRHWCAWSFVSKDRRECLATAVTIQAGASHPPLRLKLRGLDPEGVYADEEGRRHSGSVLMNAGVPFAVDYGDAHSTVWHFVQVED